MLGLLVLVALGIFGLSCGGYLNGVSCDDGGIMQLLWMIAIAVGVNQGAHGLGKRS